MTRRIFVSFGMLVLALVIQGLYVTGFSTPYGVSPLKPLDRFELELGEWRGAHIELEDRIVERAGVSEYVNAMYSKSGANAWFYVGYYDGSTMASIHQPELCFPGNGWEAEDRSVLTLTTASAGLASFNSVQFRKGARSRLAAYAFFYDARFHADQAVVENGRVFGPRHFAVVTVALEFYGSVDRAKEKIEDLLEHALPGLLDYLPRSEKSYGYVARSVEENN